MSDAERRHALPRPRVAIAASLSVGIAVLALGGAAAATRQSHSAHPRPRVILAPRSGPVGTPVSVRGSGFRSRVKGVVVFGGRHVGSFTATRAGGFLLRFTVPAGFSGHTRLTAEELARGPHGS